MSPGGASIPNIETPGSVGQPDEEYKPNAAMEEMIITFLIRVALVIEPKDKEASSMYKQALELLTQALEVWPNANVKFNYLEKLLSNIQPSQSKDPATALAQGLDVMNKVADLVLALSELAYTDANVAYHMWVLVFPIVWVTLHKEEQVALAKPMIALLSKDYHKKQQGSRPNVVQAILEGLHLSHPQPRMPSELIKYIGKTYNAWHISLALLESHVMLFMNEAKCSESLAELYRLLNEEEDMRCGLLKKVGVSGMFLADYGKSVDNYEILLDCLWKVPDWAYMKDNVIPKAQVEETPKLRTVVAIAEMSVQSRTPLLQLFQQLVEVQESARILMDIANGNKANIWKFCCSSKCALYYWLRTFLMERRDVAAKSELGRNIALAQQRMQQTISGPAAGTHNMVDGGARPSNHPGASEGQIHQGTQSSGVGGSHEVGNSQTHESERGPTVESSGNSGHEQPPQSSSAISENAQIGSRRNAALSWVASAASGFDAAKDIMEALRVSLVFVDTLMMMSEMASIRDCVRAFLSEIGSRFVTLPEERLLAVVNALLHRCYKYPTATTAEVPQSLKKELSDFERDLDPESTATFPATLSDLTERLKHWKNVLQSNVEDRFPPVLKLEEESKVLRDFHAVDVEIPGQYFTDQEVAPDHTVKLDRVGADIPTVRRHGTTSRRLTLIGSDDWGRSPNKILFAKNTGKIFQIDFHPAYDANGMIEFNEPVPFRLTRNMQAFFSHFGVEGLIVSAMCAAAQSVVSPKQTHHIWHQLAMFFRDELLSWSWRRPLGMPSSTIAASGIGQLDFEQKVTTNVEHVIGRIKGISPQYFTEEEESTTDPPQSVQRGVTDLVEAALSPRNLCMMDPTWHPWF
ncbi:hypothetical protein J5N97_012741 [Dioscorea zingiberensis]|uniref:FATC domain-containing protein n=1 Tax=Dioscorea zingiberensis TaxID=325984 RepID=A0A9D5HIE3_9LILI|nr:hypothetical protein J5N97_012741 [Dioscorea zingiberensis]